MKRKIRIISGILLILLLVALGGCRSNKNSPEYYERMEKKMEKEETKAMEASKKEHLKIQSKATRKMMRDSRKRAKKLNKPKKR